MMICGEKRRIRWKWVGIRVYKIAERWIWLVWDGGEGHGTINDLFPHSFLPPFLSLLLVLSLCVLMPSAGVSNCFPVGWGVFLLFSLVWDGGGMETFKRELGQRSGNEWEEMVWTIDYVTWNYAWMDWTGIRENEMVG